MVCFWYIKVNTLQEGDDDDDDDDDNDNDNNNNNSVHSLFNEVSCLEGKLGSGAISHIFLELRR